MQSRTLQTVCIGKTTAAILLIGILAFSLCGQALKQTVVYLPYEEARPVLEAEAEALPFELRSKGTRDLAETWPGWVARRDLEIRTRLAQGDEDSLINFLLFGTSYTKEPRLTAKQLSQLGPIQQTAADGMETNLARVLQARIFDLIRALSTRANNERLTFARHLLESKGYQLNTPAGREQVRQYLLTSLVRMLSEHARYAKTLEEARLLGNATEEFAERSRLFRERGLSSDTSLLPNFALEESLKALQSRQLLAPSSVRRVAVIGPGLDFTDKQEGYDFYPQQTLQPFAIIDTLFRLHFADPRALEVITFDLSPRVNDHLARARERAKRGQSYVVQLPRDLHAQWKPEAIRYWERFGNQIGDPVRPVLVPAGAGELRIRAVSIRPEIVSRVTPVDLNIVLQRLSLSSTHRFDLIIATNVLVYYDVFEQSLSLTNIEDMLRPGGILLSNNALLELPFFKTHSVGYLTVVYSDRPNDGDHIVWYRRSAD